MKKLGKKNVIQDGTMVAFACPCDCSVVCNSASCTPCLNSGGYASLKAVDNARALNHGGSSVTTGMGKSMEGI